MKINQKTDKMLKKTLWKRKSKKCDWYKLRSRCRLWASTNIFGFFRLTKRELQMLKKRYAPWSWCWKASVEVAENIGQVIWANLIPISFDRSCQKYWSSDWANLIPISFDRILVMQIELQCNYDLLTCDNNFCSDKLFVLISLLRFVRESLIFFTSFFSEISGSSWQS